MNTGGRITLTLLFLAGHTFADPLCIEQDPSELERLQITVGDRREICTLIANRHDYSVVLVARSHEDLYDFPMIEVHMAEISMEKPMSGPVFFYWKRDGKWSELKEVSAWTKRTVAK